MGHLLWLKQIDGGLLTERGRAILHELFPGFVMPRRNKPWLYRVDEVDPHPQAPVPPWEPRRFAGDHALPRGRYYSLAHDEEGSDDDTLANELLAYGDGHEVGLFFLSEREVSLREGEQRDAVVLTFDPPFRGRVLVAEMSFVLDERKPLFELIGGHPGRNFEIWIPLRIVGESFESVVDLRAPNIADWFAQTISRAQYELGGGMHTPCFPYRRPLRSFKALLPLLLSQELGGGLFHLVAGDWLRRHGADALIYPSARNDPELHVRWGKVQAWKGWNLVDYRNAREPSGSLSIISGATYWPRRISLAMGSARYDFTQPTPCMHVGIRWSIAPWRRGSWKARGLADRVKHELALGAMTADPLRWGL